MLNFAFAFPAFWTIDTFGRRSLLLSTFPLMAAFHIMIAIGFGVGYKSGVSTGRTGVVLAGIYLFGIVYSPGEGPVPFVHESQSNEATGDR